MPAFFEYLRNITYYLMFATVIGMFAPVGNYRKFVSLVLGFVLLLLMIQPLTGLFSGRDIPVTQWFLGEFSNASGFMETEEPDSVYSGWWDEYFQSAFETQLDLQLSRLLSANGFSVHSSEFEYSNNFGELTSVRVSVSAEVRETTSFIRIEPPKIPPIRIGNSSLNEPDETSPEIETVKTLISEFYNLPKSHIHVNITKERGAVHD